MLAPGRARRYTENMKQVPVYREAVEVPALPGLFIRPLESFLLEKAQAHLDNLTSRAAVWGVWKNWAGACMPWQAGSRP